jgi:hypothetical protein
MEEIIENFEEIWRYLAKIREKEIKNMRVVRRKIRRI